MRIDGTIANALAMDAAGPQLARLRAATQDVEAIFLKDLLGAMRKGTPDEEQESSLGSDIYQDMFDQAFAQGASRADSLGIGKLLYNRLAPSMIAQEQARQLLQVGVPKTENKG